MLIGTGTNVRYLKTVITGAKRIDILKTAFIVLTLIDVGSAIRCFRCEVGLEQYYENDKLVTTPMCLKFNHSSEYAVNCPYSTMCLKTISTFTLNNGRKLETITRGCAQQKNSTEVFRNRSWHTEHSVQEVYSEGCTANTGNNLVGAALTYCYCRGDLCNSSKRLHADALLFVYYLPIIAVIILSKMFLKILI